MTCSIYDVGCNLQTFTQWLYSFVAPYLDPILNLMSSLITLIACIFIVFVNLFVSIVSLGISINLYLIGYLYAIFSTDPTAFLIISLLSSYVSIVVFLRIWNILSGTTIWGFKIPKIPI